MDLSLEGTYGFAPMLAAWLIVPVAAFGSGADLSPVLGLLVLLLAGGCVGLINGTLIVKARLNGFIVTLGMTIVLAGLQNGIPKAQTLFALPRRSATLGRPIGARSRSRWSSPPLFLWGWACSCSTTGGGAPSTR